MTDRTIGPLCRRMTEDMTVRGFTAGTQRGYIRAVQDFTAFLGRPPDRADAEELRRYQLYMRSAGVSATGMNAVVSALRFFFGVTLGREDAQTGMTTVREPRKLPVVPSPEEMTGLLDAAPGLEYRAALSVTYGAGLRASEVVSLKHAAPPCLIGPAVSSTEACPTPAPPAPGTVQQRQASDNPSHSRPWRAPPSGVGCPR